MLSNSPAPGNDGIYCDFRMIRRLGQRFATLFRAVTPDPFVLAIGLTAVVFALAITVEHATPTEILRAWQDDAGLWSLLAFAMQMAIMLVTGHALAEAPVVRRALARAANLPTSPRTAAALVALVAMLAALLNWGLGLIVGALFAREVGRSAHARGIRLDYPLLVAAGYTGLVCWHGGLSGSAPLKVTQTKDLVEVLGPTLGAQLGSISLHRTVFSWTNAVVTGGLVVLIPTVCALLSPRDGERVDTFPMGGLPATPEVAAPGAAAQRSFASRVESSRAFAALVVVPLAAATWMVWRERGLARLDPNAINLLFLTLGLLLHGSVDRYVAAVGTAASGTAGIVLQFPFYGGIMGVMRATGLARTLAGNLAKHVSATLLPAATVVSAGVLNMFIPSGGGQWAVQGPIALESAMALGVPPELVVLGVSYGDELTNMMQPFWALPLLAITGVRARDILGYTVVVMLAAGAWMLVALTAITAFYLAH
ncbi:MAG: short-chain fatty acid transporter [Myxococcales bacterium]|nr:short-chain fatty acid transporter [Myxococcales bacterium]